MPLKKPLSIKRIKSVEVEKECYEEDFSERPAPKFFLSVHTVRTARGRGLKDLTEFSPKLGVWTVSDSSPEIKRAGDRW